MSRTDRRMLLRLIAATMVVLPGAAAAAPAASRFAPPSQPMRYTRRLERQLADGAHLAVTRSFVVRFVRNGRGFRVEGEQVDVQVEAPEALAAFASLERQRRENGLFPLTLDGDGRITGGAAPPAARLDDAVREAVARIDQHPRDMVERAELLQFVNAIQQSAGGVLTELPHDLFAPGHDRYRESRTIELPDGRAGAVTVTFSATTDPSTGLMREAAREVLTDLGGERRRTLESWALTPLP